MTKPLDTASSRPARKRFEPVFDVAGLGAAYSVLFIYVELAQAAGYPHWLGGTAAAWREAALGLGVYFFAIALPALGLSGCIVLFVKGERLRRTLAIVITFAAAMLCWTGLSKYNAGAPAFLGIAIPAAIGGILAIVVLLSTSRLASAGVAALFVALALSGAAVTLALHMRAHAMASDYTSHAITASLVWLSISGVVSVVVWALALKTKPWHAFRIVAVACVCASYPLCLAAQPHAMRLVPKPDRVNLLLISADTMRADLCSVYGGPVPTPNLERLAARGALFENHYSLAPWTVPSINGLMSSKYPPSLTPDASASQRALEEYAYQNLARYWLDAQGVPYSKDLGNAGYATAAVYANPTIRFQEWLLGGFDSVRMVDALFQEEPVRFVQLPLLRNVFARFWHAAADERLVDSSAAVTNYGLAYLEQHTADPFFLWLHYMDPHTPYDPPEQFRNFAAPWPMFPPASTYFVDAEAFSDAEWAAARALYEGEIRYVDECVGRVLTRLEALGLMDNTVVCFISDHGEEFVEHGRWAHGHDLFEEQLHVPLIIAGPGVPQSRITTRVSSIDLLPTLSELIGVDAEPSWRGTSLTANFKEDTQTHRPVFAQATHHARYLPEPQRMVIDGDLKLIVGLISGTRRLFDLAKDPKELNNLADQRPADVERLAGLLDAWSTSFASDFEQAAAQGGAPPAASIDEDLREVMRGLGYVQ